MKVGEEVRRIRELKNISSEYIAEQLSIEESLYLRFERNEYEFEMPYILKIADILKVNFIELFYPNEKSVFNNYSCSVINQGNITNIGMFDDERQLYKDKIKLLEEKISWLQHRNIT